MKPTFFELNGLVASIIPSSEGVEVTVPPNTSIAEFMQDGSIISEEEYNKLKNKAI